MTSLRPAIQNVSFKNKVSLSLLDISDVHLFNKKTPTQTIAENLRYFLTNSVNFASIDIFCISGDFFDREVLYANEETAIVEELISFILRLCKKHDVILRVLEGTPSHDRKQPAVFEKLNSILELEVDVKWVKDLSVEYIDKFDKYILYIPDEWGSGPESTLVEVKSILENIPGKKVDIAIMHGNFPHQLPAHLKFPMHDPVEYQNLVKSVIIIGHIHIHSIHGKIICPGSFDRISQGEEGPKGGVLVNIKDDSSFEAKFIENKNAKIYRKIICSGLPLEEAYAKIDEVALQVPNESELMIVCGKEDPLMHSGDIFTVRYPFINWRIESDAPKKKMDKEAIKRSGIVKHGNELTGDNIRDILLDRVKAKIGDPDLLSRCKKFLDEKLC